MKTILKIGMFVLITTFHNQLLSQSNKEKALEMGMEAIELIDNGQYKEANKLLKAAAKLDPDNYFYPYEIGLIHYLKKDYKKSIKLMEKIKHWESANDQVYQMLGNSYSLSGNRAKAIAAYEEGLKRFPNSGNLHLERGNMEMFVKEYGKALSYYEKGIRVAPTHASNYYWATKFYCSSTEEVWGMIYGEIFMNLERGSKRTAEISELLFNTYKSEIKFISDTSFAVSFCQNMSITLDENFSVDDIKMPFGLMVYEMLMIKALINEKEINIASLNRVRTRFLDLYYEMEHNETYPNVLFDYQRKVQQAGHFEAYNYWLLLKGDEDGFRKWHANNKGKYDAFIDWYIDNPIQINTTNAFHSELY